MNIVNLTDTDIVFKNLGFTLVAEESINLKDIADFYTLGNYLDELVQPLIDGNVKFEEDGNTFTIAGISSYLSTGLTKVDITQNSEETLNVTIENADELDSNTFSDDYYYFDKKIRMIANQLYTIEFKGYIKEAFIDLKSGNVSVDFNDMGEIQLKDYTHFEFDLNYKLKDPILHITCNKISDLELFVEGVYNDDIKSKQQYLEELNAVEPEIDVPILKDKNELLFNVNLKDASYYNDKVFIDIIGNKVGNIETTSIYSDTFQDNFIFNNMYINFGEVMNINPSKDYTISAWFKFDNEISNQDLLHNKYEYILSIYNKNLYFTNGNKKILILKEPFKLDKFYNIILTFTNNTWSIFLDGEFITQFKAKIKNKLSDLLIGTSKNPLNNIIIEKIKMYNYSFSQSMINYLINTQNPDVIEDIETNYSDGIRVNYYDASNVSIYPKDNYNFTILEKKYCNQSYLNGVLEFDNINFNIEDTKTELLVIEGYINFEYQGVYKFELESLGSCEFILDEESVVNSFNSELESNSSKKFIPNGYHKFKLRYFGKDKIFNLKWILPEQDDDTLDLINNFKRKNILETIGLFGMNNCTEYGCVFDTDFDSNKANLVETDDYNYYELKNLNILRFKDMTEFNHQHIFTFNYWIYTSSGYNYIFSIGNKNYSDYLAGYSSRDTIRNSFESTRITTKSLDLNKWTMVTVTGNGNTLTYYKNGVEVGTSRQYANRYYEYSPMYVNFGTVSSGYPLSYMRLTNFKLSDWFYDDKLYSKTELLAIYKKQGSKYGL